MFIKKILKYCFYRVSEKGGQIFKHYVADKKPLQFNRIYLYTKLHLFRFVRFQISSEKKFKFMVSQKYNVTTGTIFHSNLFVKIFNSLLKLVIKKGICISLWIQYNYMPLFVIYYLPLFFVEKNESYIMWRTRRNLFPSNYYMMLKMPAS